MQDQIGESVVKIFNTIDSCETSEHLALCKRMIANFTNLFVSDGFTQRVWSDTLESDIKFLEGFLEAKTADILRMDLNQ